jgi:hypothetical protein
MIGEVVSKNDTMQIACYLRWKKCSVEDTKCNLNYIEQG